MGCVAICDTAHADYTVVERSGNLQLRALQQGGGE